MDLLKPTRSTRSLVFVALAVLLVVAAAVTMTSPARSAGNKPSTNSIDSSESTPQSAPSAKLTTADEPGMTTIGTFSQPVELLSRPNDPRLFVVEQGGQIVAVDDDDRQVVLDISTSTAASAEQGLLGAAFSPTAPLLYVHYTDLEGDSVVEEFAIADDTGIADPLSGRIVLTVEQPYENHNGGKLAFGPDGYLYLGLGDGGLADDPDRTALDISSPLGKILRFDPTPSGDAAFTIPDDNPYVLNAGANPLIWSLGLRNPWKFSFDSLTGDLWIADVGQNQFEEINFAAATDVTAGRDASFGWSAFEGVTRFNADQDDQGHIDPLVTYPRDDGRCSITGGEVYRGESHPELAGWYLFGDYCTGEVLAFDTTLDADERSIVQIASVPALVAISASADGEIYTVSHAGDIMQLS